jgi:DNA-binding response OmpR family regulator
MTKVFLIGLESTIVSRITQALNVERHWTTQAAQTIRRQDLTAADIVFAGGPATEYLPLLRWVREERPELPFVVVTRVAETKEWLNALEAGATDYCSSPFETRHIHWLMETALQNMAPYRHRLD